MPSKRIKVINITASTDTWLATPYSIDVEDDATVYDIKKELEHKTSVPISEQFLIACTGKNSWMLNDNNRSVQNLPDTTSSDPFFLSLYTRLSPRSRLLKFIITTHGPTSHITTELWSFATVDELKIRIDEMLGIPPYRQNLHLCLCRPRFPALVIPLGSLDCMLEDVVPDCSVHRIHVQKFKRHNGAVLSPVRVVLEPGTEATFEMDLYWDTVYSLMGEIRAFDAWKEMISERNFILRAAYNGDMLVYGDRTLATSGVEANHILQVLLSNSSKFD